MECDKYMELLSARLDGALTEEEERELEEHLTACPDCRAAGAQLAALRSAFAEWEEIPAPEGFAQGVMDRIRGEKKVIPLFKRPQFRALAGLAACLVVAVGLYGASQRKDQEKTMLMTRSFQQDVLEETVYGADASACESLDGEADAPQIAAYAAPVPEDSGTMGGMRKAVPDSDADGLSGDWAYAEVTLILDRLPQGAEELLPSDATVIYDEEAGGDVYTWLTTQELAAIEKLAFEQGLIAGTTEIFPSSVGARCALIVRRG